MKRTILAVLLLMLGLIACGEAGINHGKVGSTPACDGTINLSTGCTMPMLGGL